MISVSKYHEMMEHIELTDAMRERVIENIRAKQKRRNMNQALKWISTAAACLVIGIGVAVLLNREHIPHGPDDPPAMSGTDIQPGWQCDEYENVTTLSEAFGIQLHDAEMPFAVTEKSYCILLENIAQLEYFGADSEDCCIRIGKDTEDISGDYNEYDTVTESDIDGVKITLSGNGELVYLAAWIEDGRFCSVSMSEGTEKETMLSVIRSWRG